MDEIGGGGGGGGGYDELAAAAEEQKLCQIAYTELRSLAREQVAAGRVGSDGAPLPLRVVELSDPSIAAEPARFLRLPDRDAAAAAAAATAPSLLPKALAQVRVEPV